MTSTPRYALVDFEEERSAGRKWFVGPFEPEDSDTFSHTIEIGYVNLQQVESTDQLHFHSRADEFYLLLKGQMQIEVGEVMLEVFAGQLLRVPPYVPHLIRWVQPGTQIVLIKAPPGLDDKTIVTPGR